MIGEYCRLIEGLNEPNRIVIGKPDTGAVVARPMKKSRPRAGGCSILHLRPWLSREAPSQTASSLILARRLFTSAWMWLRIRRLGGACRCQFWIKRQGRPGVFGLYRVIACMKGWTTMGSAELLVHRSQGVKPRAA